MPVDLRPRNGSRGPELCAYHGDFCRMGQRWPLPDQFVELHDMFRNAAIARGDLVEDPDPFTFDRHRPQNKQERLESAAALAVAAAENELMYAAICADGQQ